jgi:magnesium transporter
VIRSLYRSADGAIRRDVQPHEMRSLSEAGGLLWIHLTGRGPQERDLLDATFSFHQLAIDDCFNGRVDTPKIDDYGTHLFIVSQAVTYEPVTSHLDLREVDMFLGKEYVVTICAVPVDAIDELYSRASETGAFMDRGADMLAHNVLDSLVDLLLPSVEDLHDVVDELERSMLESPEKAHLSSLLVLKRNALRIRRSILPARDLVNRLSRGEFPELIRHETQIFYRDIYDHTVRVEELIETLRDVADGALSTYLSAVNNRMNEVMKTLSIVAAIFLPLTLIASIFGTNLDYSPFGLTLGFGFFFMLAVMLVIAGAMILYFRLRGWF